ncbi:glutaredoxin family protein [Bacillus halotolerans]|uniref:glutaredoxin family protein n=1 Tax=Bacillus TaxID=1386 RepID=UPI0011626423|nr:MULTISPECIES: glutaredoxin family protein [Bacillus]MBV7318492.1 glutaredoxin family protein [Halalkalibacterium halodurans]MCP9300074.1 glutaredoxin family protein [Bacillus halotolerans]MCV0022620.1 glutaredoxin family protein [Bacillus sp. XT-2]QDK66431.1 glutaredoxin family protein [Bacillus halotolerans]QNS19180.1 glutaredoxin family protein [Bacillus halotolerans]
MSDFVNVVVWSKKGCIYCEEVKNYLHEKAIAFQNIDVSEKEELRDILQVKYGVRHVPVVEVGGGNRYEGITEIGIKNLELALANYAQIKEEKR